MALYKCNLVTKSLPLVYKNIFKSEVLIFWCNRLNDCHRNPSTGQIGPHTTTAWPAIGWHPAPPLPATHYKIGLCTTRSDSTPTPWSFALPPLALHCLQRLPGALWHLPWLCTTHTYSLGLCTTYTASHSSTLPPSTPHLLTPLPWSSLHHLCKAPCHLCLVRYCKIRPQTASSWLLCAWIKSQLHTDQVCNLALQISVFGSREVAPHCQTF